MDATIVLLRIVNLAAVRISVGGGQVLFGLLGGQQT
jgi:hypothetical protein